MRYPVFRQKIKREDILYTSFEVNRKAEWIEWASSDKKVLCIHCNGTKIEPDNDGSSCSMCGGNGWMTERQAAEITWYCDNVHDKGIACTI